MPLTLAVLDANVLVPVSLTDTLLRSAELRRYVPLWTDAILDEVIRNVARLHPEHGTDGANRRVRSMNTAFPGAMVTGWEHLEAEMTNDPKDRHVLAAAVEAGAEVIVTNNISDFPDSACHPYGILVRRKIRSCRAEGPIALVGLHRDSGGLERDQFERPWPPNE